MRRSAWVLAPTLAEAHAGGAEDHEREADRRLGDGGAGDVPAAPALEHVVRGLHMGAEEELAQKREGEHASSVAQAARGGVSARAARPWIGGVSRAGG